MPSPRLPVKQRWLWVTRVFALIPIVAVVIYVAAFCIPRFRNSCYDDTRPIAVYLLILILPYVLSSLGLWARKPKKLKNGLAWARIVGTFWSAICLALAVGAFSAGEIAIGLLALLVATTQAVLVVSAVKTYRSLEPEEDDRGLLIKRVLLFIPYTAFLLMGVGILPSMLRSRPDIAAASAVGGLRTINTAEAAYKETYGKGYSPSLAFLGPPAPGATPNATAADLINERLASGAEGEYTLAYLPDPAAAVGDIQTYTLTAVPNKVRCTNWRRFFADQTGIIRWTRGNRTATVHDPPLE